jgi:hypothetical protein
MTMTSTMMLNRAHDGSVNDEHDDSVDPAVKATRRRFTREFKRRIVDEYDAADRRGTRRGVAPDAPSTMPAPHPGRTATHAPPGGRVAILPVRHGVG